MLIDREELAQWVQHMEDHKAEIQKSMIDHPETVCACGCSSFYHSDHVEEENLEYLSKYYPHYLAAMPDEANEEIALIEWRGCYGNGCVERNGERCEAFWRLS
jgi:hypothetical protein